MKLWLTALLGLAACRGNDVDILSKRSPAGHEPSRASALAARTGSKDPMRDALRELDKDPSWFHGWNGLALKSGAEFGPFPDAETPKTIKATPMKHGGSVQLLDYWIRPTGYTTMWQHALLNYTDKSFRTDGVRWDTPTKWVPAMADGKDSGGNLTLMTQFGPDVPGYWAGAQPRAPQTDWIFKIDYQTGSIMEIFDRQHFSSRNGAISASFGEVVAKGYWDALYWSPGHDFVVGSSWRFKGAARFADSRGVPFDGYSAVRVAARYDTFTVPPSRNRGQDCPAAEFKDVIAVRHQQWWWDPTTQTSRGDYLMIYMAKNVGWIYQLLNNAETYDAGNNLIQGADRFVHYAPVGYLDQTSGKRLCPHEFRDLMRPGQAP
jgi:hypothetical protein